MVDHLNERKRGQEKYVRGMMGEKVAQYSVPPVLSTIADAA